MLEICPSRVATDALTSKTVLTTDGRRLPLHSEITAEEGVFLQDLIRAHRPASSLEIGCAYGISSLFICEALLDVGAREHIVIDPNQNDQWEGIGLLNLSRGGCSDLVKFYSQPSYITLAHMAAEKKRIDFAFIDGMHTFDYALVDFFLIDKLLNVGGVVALDDYQYPSIYRVCRYAAANLQYRCIAGSSPRPSLRRRTMSALSRRFPFRRIARPELLCPDWEIGLPIQGRFVAFQKMAEDQIGQGPQFTRCWDTHNPF